MYRLFIIYWLMRRGIRESSKNRTHIGDEIYVDCAIASPGFRGNNRARWRKEQSAVFRAGIALSCRPTPYRKRPSEIVLSLFTMQLRTPWRDWRLPRDRSPLFRNRKCDSVLLLPFSSRSVRKRKYGYRVRWSKLVDRSAHSCRREIVEMRNLRWKPDGRKRAGDGGSCV